MNYEQRLHIEEFYNLYSSTNIRAVKSGEMRWAGHISYLKEMRNLYKMLIGKPAGMRQFGRCRDRWKDNIKMDLK
jgi:hypothetical protein